jgi:Fe-S cluster assembly ATP-binding protein
MDRLKVSASSRPDISTTASQAARRRVEILQMAMLKPRIAILDETDSGLDIDALKVVAGG